MGFKREHLFRLLDEGFGKTAWHGTNLRGSLRTIDAVQASWRPARGRHNIWEIVVHAAYWKYTVRRRITGDRRGSFAYPGHDWFPRPTTKEGPSDWKNDVALLAKEDFLLRSALEALPAQRLTELSAKGKWTMADMLAGVAFHDVYHAGQIQLLKRLQKKSARSR